MEETKPNLSAQGRSRKLVLALRREPLMLQIPYNARYHLQDADGNLVGAGDADVRMFDDGFQEPYLVIEYGDIMMVLEAAGAG